ncbi:MAG: (deoxy)nucleoside triphosphate pyrophosphohydrolase [Saccharofermentans sp.]|nr:(deoxy)nucleoside triphosphate pyrophosphohydrolase [Saccharofermentans sp.]
MKTLNVVAAIIEDDGKILATQRGYGEFKDKWEFPGGKIKEGESESEALIREIREELDCDIIPGKELITVNCDYPDFHLVMHCIWAHLKEGEHIKLLEHEGARWLTKDTLYSVDWLPADIEVAKAIFTDYFQS